MESLSKIDELAVFSLETINSHKLIVVRMDNEMLIQDKLRQQLKFDYLWMLSRADISINEEEMMRELNNIDNIEVVLASPNIHLSIGNTASSPITF
jgi:hypothetical protein